MMQRAKLISAVFLAVFMWGALVVSYKAAQARTQGIALEGVTDAVRFTDNITNYRSALDGGEDFSAIGSATAASAGANIGQVTTITCTNYATVAVPVELSVASATVVLTAVRYFWDGTTLTYQGSEQQTMTAQATYTVSTLYPATAEAEFPTYGCNVMKILAADPSSGTVTLGPAKVH